MKTKDKPIPSNAKYSIDMAFTIYELAKAGTSEVEIAKTLNIHETSLRTWKKKYKSVAEAIKQGKALHKDKEEGGNFYDFVAGRLPSDLTDLWNELIEADDDPNAIARLEKMIATHGRQARQRLFLHALMTFNFDIGRACRFVNIQRATFTNWKTSDLNFSRLIDEVIELRGDFYEHALVRLVRMGCVPAILHANKSYNAKRGYSTKTEVHVTGQIEQKHTISIGELDLPFDTRVAMLTAIREKRAALQKASEAKVIEVKASSHD